MQGRKVVASLKLLGVFRLEQADGRKLEVSSKRGQAMIAVLALSENGERARSWLQTLLWPDRSPEQASASLRRELSNLRKSLLPVDDALMTATNQAVRLDLDRICVDALETTGVDKGELLEGLDIRGADGFEDWLRAERRRRADPSVDGAPPSAPPPPIDANDAFLNRPAIAVLRFACQPNSDDNEVIADGLAEDFIDQLARLRWLPVISRNTSFGAGPADSDPRELGKAVGARYLLSGRINWSAGNSSVRLVLDDASDGSTLWTQSIELGAEPRELGFVELTTELASAVGIRIDQAEQAKALTKEKADLSAAELVWRGRWHLNRLNAQDNQLAEACFLKALEKQPAGKEARIQLTWLRLRRIWLERGTEQDIRNVRRDAQKIILADGEDARGHMLAGIAEVFLRQPLRAERLLRQAIDLDPCLVMAHVQLGGALILRGESGEAEQYLRNGIRLSPNDSDMFFFQGELALARLLLDDPQSALNAAETSLSMRSGYWLAHCTKIAALLDLEREAEAQRAYTDLKTEQPNFEMRQIDWLPAVDPFVTDKLKAGLNQAAALSD